jgi:hypothetical protein
VAIHLQGGSGAATDLSASATSPFTWDTTKVADGSYVITVEASDGVKKSTSQATVRVQNLFVKQVGTVPSVVPAGQAVTITIDVSGSAKDVKSVQAVFRPAGSAPEAVQMTKQANGQWSVSYTPKLKAQYSVDLLLTFSDNTQGAVPNFVTFSAEGQPAGANIGALLPVAALAVLVVVLGVFGIRRWS